MSKTLSSSSRAGLSWTYTNTVTGVGDTANTNSFNYQASMTSGTGAGQADLLYVAQATIAGAANLDLDLNGSLTDNFGNTLNMLRVKMVLLVPDPTSTASGFKCGNAAANQFQGWFGAVTHTESADKTGVIYKSRTDATGWAVTPATGDIFRITNLDGSNPLILNIAIVGCSA